MEKGALSTAGLVSHSETLAIRNPTLIACLNQVNSFNLFAEFTFSELHLLFFLTMQPSRTIRALPVSAPGLELLEMSAFLLNALLNKKALRTTIIIYLRQ